MLTDEQRAAYPFVVLCPTCGADVVRTRTRPDASAQVVARAFVGLDGVIFTDGDLLPRCVGCGGQWLNPLPAVRDETRHGERGGHAESV